MPRSRRRRPRPRLPSIRPPWLLLAIVTGAGIGRSSANLFAAKGARLELYLASDDASCTTGSAMLVDGGAPIPRS